MKSGRIAALGVGLAAAGSFVLLLNSCSTTPLSLAEPPAIPGATFVGNKTCAECHHEIARKIRCWINIGGLLRGTPISDSLLGTRWWQRGVLSGYLAWTRAHPGGVCANKSHATCDSTSVSQ